jgi:predicted dehydrogenase
MDYLQHGYSKRCKIVCERGTIVWDFTHKKIGIITTADGKWSWQNMKTEIHYNHMYMDEIKYFLDCVSSNRETFNSIKHSLPVLKLAIAANKSCFSNIWENI